MGNAISSLFRATPKNSDESYQDAISQFPFLNGYTHALQGFVVLDETPREAIVAALQAALDKIKSEIPWLAGQVVNVGSGPGNSGAFTCAPWPTDDRSHNEVRVKDCADLFPPYAEIIKAGGPVSMLDGRHLAPWPGLPLPAGISPAPVVAMQANFVTGGLLLVTSFHHNVMDGTGILQFTELLATVMCGGEIPSDAITQANRDRTRVIPLLTGDEPIKDHSYLRRPADLILRPLPPLVWCIFRVRLAAIPTLKALASDREGWDDSIPFISSHDALSAFCWKRIATVRLANGRRPDQISKFGRAIDVRRVMEIPSTYMGQMIYHAATRLPLGTVATAPLSTLACALRRDLNETNTQWSVRSYVTFLASETDKSKLLYGGPYNPDTDIGNSSPVTAMHGFNPLRFGLLGQSNLHRKPNGAPIPGCLYFINPDNETDMPLLMCLTKEDMEALKNDPDWSQYMEYIG